MKRTITMFMAICMLFSSIVFNQASVSAVSKPARVKSLSVKRVGKTAVKVSWKKVKGVKGYLVYMKTNSGKFKKITTTTSTKITKKNLKIGNKYLFKVRTYKNCNGKKIYSSYSITNKITLKAYEYLVNKVYPYATYGGWGYTEYKEAKSLTMGGNKYYNSFSLNANYGDTAYAIYNLNGKYSKLEFYLAPLGSGSKELIVECDDEVEKIINVEEYSLPKKYTIDIKGTYKLKLSYFKEWWTDELGFGNVKLYY